MGAGGSWLEHTLPSSPTLHHCIWLAPTPCSHPYHYQHNRKHHTSTRMHRCTCTDITTELHGCLQTCTGIYTNTQSPHTHICAAADAVAAGHQVKPAWRWQLHVPNEALINCSTKQWIREKQSSPPGCLLAARRRDERGEDHSNPPSSKTPLPHF